MIVHLDQPLKKDLIMNDKWNKIKKDVMDKCKTDLSIHKENLSKDTQDYFLRNNKSRCSDYESEGLYFKEYTLLWDKLVPDFGESKTIIGEFIRILGRLNHEYYNNGNCNLQDAITEECEYCDGTGYEECTRYDCEEGYIIEEDLYGNEEKVLCPDCDGDYQHYADCQYCGGEMYVPTGEYEITNMWANMFEFVADKIGYITNDVMKVLVSLEHLMDMLKNHYCYLDGRNATYNDKLIERYYNTFTDELMYVILKSETNPVNPLYEIAEV